MENKLLNKATFTYNHSEKKLESVMTHNAFGDILEAIYRLMVCLNYNPTDKFKKLLDRDDDIAFSQDFVYELQILDEGQSLICSTAEIDEDIIEGILRVLINEDFNFASRMYGLSLENTKPFFIKAFKDVVEDATFNKDEFM